MIFNPCSAQPRRVSIGGVTVLAEIGDYAGGELVPNVATVRTLRGKFERATRYVTDTGIRIGDFVGTLSVMHSILPKFGITPIG